MRRSPLSYFGVHSAGLWIALGRADTLCFAGVAATPWAKQTAHQFVTLRIGCNCPKSSTVDALSVLILYAFAMFVHMFFNLARTFIHVSQMTRSAQGIFERFLRSCAIKVRNKSVIHERNFEKMKYGFYIRN
jgi:hypothetical protein